ncbi:MAG: RES family NAD+ phosphorylase [Desulfuromonadales bacterium]|nr:RES family NAD+ phosphorylase [Desulfuromonadales bacterium]
MIVYRVTPARHASDLTREGSRHHGGRWNPPGIPMTYTSSSVALASIECFVSTPSEIVSQSNFQRVDILIPDDVPAEVIHATDLPSNWPNTPAPDFLSEIGRKWAESGSSLILIVPSAALGGHENIVLINPRHSQKNEVKVVSILPFSFDLRLIK